MSHVFISYNQEDSDFSEILHNKLHQAEFTVWTDLSGLRGGDDWRREIDQAIKDAFALIVIMTPTSKDSEYVTYEWAFAWGAGVKVIPILLKKTVLHPRLESLQYLDFTNRHARPWDTLVKLLQEAEASKPAVKATKAEKVELQNAREKNAYKRMREALDDVNWTWRSIERLAAIGGVSEEEALEILRNDSNVVLSVGKSRRRIAKLKSK